MEDTKMISYRHLSLTLALVAILTPFAGATDDTQCTASRPQPMDLARQISALRATMRTESFPNYCCNIEVAGPTEVKTGGFDYDGKGYMEIDEFPDGLCLGFRGEKVSRGSQDYFSVSLRKYDCDHSEKWEVVFKSLIVLGTKEFEISSDRFAAKVHCKQQDWGCGPF